MYYKNAIAGHFWLRRSCFKTELSPKAVSHFAQCFFGPQHTGRF
jgi:hypothetical protein